MENKPFFIRLASTGDTRSAAIIDLRTVACAERRPIGGIALHFISGGNLVCHGTDAEAVWGILNETARNPEDVKGGRQLEAYP